jgi:hypothetical protein
MMHSYDTDPPGNATRVVRASGAHHQEDWTMAGVQDYSNAATDRKSFGGR